MCHGVEKNLKSKRTVTNILFAFALYPDNEFAAFFYLYLSKALVGNFDYFIQIDTQEGKN